MIIILYSLSHFNMLSDFCKKLCLCTLRIKNTRTKKLGCKRLNLKVGNYSDLFAATLAACLIAVLTFD